MKTMTLKEWHDLGRKLYGDDMKKWKFKCVRCGHVQTAQDFIDLELDPNSYVHFTCIGRFNQKKVGCDWTLGGLFSVHKVEIVDEEGNHHPTFEFADDENE